MNKNVPENGKGKDNSSKRSAAHGAASEDARLRYFLQKALKKETAPESLRDSIRRMIRK